MAREMTTHSEDRRMGLEGLRDAAFDADRMVDEFIVLTEWMRDRAPDGLSHASAGSDRRGA